MVDVRNAMIILGDVRNAMIIFGDVRKAMILLGDPVGHWFLKLKPLHDVADPTEPMNLKRCAAVLRCFSQGESKLLCSGKYWVLS